LWTSTLFIATYEFFSKTETQDDNVECSWGDFLPPEFIPVLWERADRINSRPALKPGYFLSVPHWFRWEQADLLMISAETGAGRQCSAP
jgi:hypothetical protein